MNKLQKFLYTGISYKDGYLTVQEDGPIFRLVDRVFDYPSKSLCVLFWQLVWSVYIHIGAVVGVVLPLAGTVMFGVQDIFSILLPFLNSIDNPWVCMVALILLCLPLLAYAALCGLAVIVAAGFFIHAVFYGIPNKLAGRGWDEPAPEEDKQPSIVMEYIRAKKSKVCPMVKYE